MIKAARTQTSTTLLLRERTPKTGTCNFILYTNLDKDRNVIHDTIAGAATKDKRTYLKNKKYAIQQVSNLTDYMIDQGVVPHKGWIRSVGAMNFDVIIAVPQDEYLSDHFAKYYIKVNEMEHSINNSVFKLSISFINADKKIDQERLHSDSYALMFEIQSHLSKFIPC